MLWRPRTDEDFSDEVQAHLRLEAERLIEDGMTPEAARAAARKAFGNVASAQERFHESTRLVWLEQFVQDVRYALRGMRKNPAFFATSVLTLAAGLGLLTVFFTVFNAYVLRPFAVHDPARLYRVAWRAPDAVGVNFPVRKYDELRARTDLFDGVIADDARFITSQGRTLSASFVSDNYFSVLGPRLLLGRALGPADTGQPVAVLGQQAWTRLLASDPAVLGSSLDLDGGRVTIVGVMREEFGGLDDFTRDLWLPLSADHADPAVEIVARVRADVTADQAAARLGAFAASVAPPQVAPDKVRIVLVSNATANLLSFELIAILSPVFAAFALVLLTACFNVSNVLLARAIARHREISVRLSLGASRSRIVRQLLTEGLVIALLGGVTSIALAAWLLRAGSAALFGTLPPIMAALLRVAPMPFDYRVFGFALGAAVAATLVFALVPALQASRQPLTDALRGQRSGMRGASRMRNALVVAQVAVSIVLVITALVLARNFTVLGGTDPGYSTTDVYSVNVRGDKNGLDSLVGPAADALARDPRIAEVAVTGGNPLFVTRSVVAAPDADAAPVPTRYTFVSPEYFTVLRIPVVRGRAFRDDEARSAARVAIVSERTARAFWPGADPIGQTIRLARPTSPRLDEIEGYTQVTVVGTTRDVVTGMIVEGPDSGHIYLPATAANPHASALLLRTHAGSGFRPDMLREVFRGIGQDPDIFEVVALAEMRDVQMYPLRAAAWVGGLLGAIALVLSISGLYGVLSYMIGQRTREIGIRMALGATGRAVVDLVVRQSLRLAGIGALIGTVIAALVMKALSSVVELDAVSLLAVTPFAVGLLLVLAATAVAAYQPARRATRVDPAETLRAEA